MGHRDDAEHVGLVDLPDGGGWGFTRLLRSGGDRGVVDEDVEAAERGVDVLGGGLDRDLVGDVQRNEPYVGAVGAKLLGRRLATLGVAGADQHGDAESCEPARRFLSDALVRTGDQSSLLRSRHGTQPPLTHGRQGKTRRLWIYSPQI